MQNSPTAAYLRECSIHERMMLVALIKVIKREGVEEVKWGDVRISCCVCSIPRQLSHFLRSNDSIRIILVTLLTKPLLNLRE
jgi:hypothetical protein